VYVAADAVELAINDQQASLQAPFAVNAVRAHLVDIPERGITTTFPKGDKRGMGAAENAFG